MHLFIIYFNINLIGLSLTCIILIRKGVPKVEYTSFEKWLTGTNNSFSLSSNSSVGTSSTLCTKITIIIN